MEDVADIFGGFVDGKDTAVGSSVDLESLAGEEFDNFVAGEAVAGRADEAGFVGAEFPEDFFGGAVVGDVALTATGNEDFCADAVGFF